MITFTNHDYPFPTVRREEQTTIQKNCNTIQKVNILKFDDYIWNHHDKCIQISTNMPAIGLEIGTILRNWETKQFCIYNETNDRGKVFHFNTPVWYYYIISS